MQLASLEFRDGDVGPSDIAARIFKHYMGGPYFGEEYAEQVTQVSFCDGLNYTLKYRDITSILEL